MGERMPGGQVVRESRLPKHKLNLHVLDNWRAVFSSPVMGSYFTGMTFAFNPFTPVSATGTYSFYSV